MSQVYDIWELMPGRVARGSIEFVIDDWEGFRIRLRDFQSDRIIRVAFDSHVAH